MIVSNRSDNKWTFTTIHDPKYRDHPVSGNRDFGYTANADGSYTFYTRGVDRLTSWDGASIQWIAEQMNAPGPFEIASSLWESFQAKVTNFVKTMEVMHILRQFSLKDLIGMR